LILCPFSPFSRGCPEKVGPSNEFRMTGKRLFHRSQKIPKKSLKNA
jgi:hypothetical protein